MSEHTAADAEVPFEESHNACMASEAARSPGTEERAVLDLLLALDFPEVSALRHQADKAEVVGRCDCGCPSIHISVPGVVPSAALPDGVVPAELRVTPMGDEPESDVILFVRNGRLDYLEYVFYTDDPPRAWPTVSRLRPFPMWP
ncbi:MAG TPA: hypothetical protein VGD71_00230 [Kribbella sp.]